MKKARNHSHWPLRAVFLVAFLIPGVVMNLLAQETTPAPARKGRSQIVDDSTKNVYGPKTTLSTTEKSLFLNQNRYVPLDTSIINYHRWTYVQRFNNFYKDLGNNGTALSPIFPTLFSTVGVTSGFTCFDPYYQTEEPRYFNTRSPFTRIYIVWGGNGRATTRIEFSRNITPRWNFGFDYRPILSDKQIQYKRPTGKRLVITMIFTRPTNPKMIATSCSLTTGGFGIASLKTVVFSLKTVIRI